MAESIKDCTWHIFIISYRPTTSAMTTVFTATNRNGPQRIAIGRNWLGLELGFGLGFRVRVYCWGCGPLYYYCCVWRWKRLYALHPLCLSVCLSPSLTCTERKKDKGSKCQELREYSDITQIRELVWRWKGQRSQLKGHVILRQGTAAVSRLWPAPLCTLQHLHVYHPLNTGLPRYNFARSLSVWLS